MTARKIEAMHRLFGVEPAHTCWGCPHLTYYEQKRRWYKCRLYGVSNSKATDWCKSYTACGMWGKEKPADFAPVFKRLLLAKRLMEYPINGQLDMFGKEFGKDENSCSVLR